MFNWILKTIVGSKNQRELRRIQPLIDQINEFEQRLGELSDDALRGKTAAWKEELSAITDSNALEARLQEILPEAFADNDLSRATGSRGRRHAQSVWP